jgi:hypothetical protein
MFCFLGESEVGGNWVGPDQIGLGAAKWQVGGGEEISSKRPKKPTNLTVSERIWSFLKFRNLATLEISL